MHSINGKIGVVCTGRYEDSVAMVEQARREALEFKYENGFDVPVQYLARRIADRNQVYTQHPSMRAMAVEMMFCAVDDERGPQIFKVDPSGLIVGYKAAAAGPKEQEARALLEKRFKPRAAAPAAAAAAAAGGGAAAEVAPEPRNTEWAIRTALTVVQNLLGNDVKPSELEVGLVTAAGFSKLSDQDVDLHLVALGAADA